MHRRRALFALLYLSEGAPIGFLWWALPARLRERGVGVEEIGSLVAFLALPWALKFLWAPALDAARRRGVGYRAFLLVAQAAMAATLLPIAFLDPVESFDLLFLLAGAHAFAAATQDIAVDALAIARIPPAERGRLNGFMQAGMLLGRSVFGGGVLLLAGRVDFRVVVFAVAGVVLAAGLLAVLFLGPDRRPERDRPPARPFFRALGHAVLGRVAIGGLLFALLAGAGFEAMGGLLTPYLVDLGYGAGTIGAFLLFPASAALAGGALLGGAVADRIGARRATGLFHPLLTLAILPVALLPALAAPPAAVVLVFLGLLYLGIGLFTASSYAFFMDLTEEGTAATRFTAFMAMTNACEAGAVWLASRLHGAGGYPGAFLALAAASQLGVLVLRFLPPRAEPGSGETPAPPPR